MRRTVVGVRVVVAVGLVLGATSACDLAQSGSAAVVGDTRITETFVNDTATESLETLGDAPAELDGAALNRQIVRNNVLNELRNRLAAQDDVTVDQADVDELIEAAVEQQGREVLELTLAQNGVPPSQLEEAARQAALQDALASSYSDDPDEGAQLVDEALADLSEEIGVSVSPRYGEWAPDQLGVVDLTSPLAVAADAS